MKAKKSKSKTLKLKGKTFKERLDELGQKFYDAACKEIDRITVKSN